MTNETQQTVLILENDPDTLDILIEALKDKGLNTEVAVRGASGLHWVEKYHPDLVLSVLQLPDMDGLDFLRQVGDTPVIFMSENDSAEEVMAVFEAGAVDYITKPYYIEEVTARVLCRLAGRRRVVA